MMRSWPGANWEGQRMWNLFSIRREHCVLMYTSLKGKITLGNAIHWSKVWEEQKWTRCSEKKKSKSYINLLYRITIRFKGYLNKTKIVRHGKTIAKSTMAKHEDGLNTSSSSTGTDLVCNWIKMQHVQQETTMLLTCSWRNALYPWPSAIIIHYLCDRKTKKKKWKYKKTHLNLKRSVWTEPVSTLRTEES